MAETLDFDAEYRGINRTDITNSMWDQFAFGPPGRFSSYYNDFHSVTLAEWVVTETGVNTQVINDAANGILLLTNAAADNDLTSMQLGNTADGGTGESWLPIASRHIWFEARLAISDATQSDMLIGLVVTDTTPLANANGIYFRKDDGDTQIDFETNNTSVASTSSAVGVMDTAFHTYGFKVTGTGQVEGYLDGVLVATLTSRIPTTELRVTCHIQNGEAVAKTLSWDYVFVAQTRVP